MTFALGNPIPTLDDVLGFLRSDFPAFVFSGGQEADGFWIRAEKPADDWAWERRRMQSAFVAYQLAKAGLTSE